MTVELDETMGAVVRERIAQIEKWGDSFPGRSEERWLMILLEEIAEALDEEPGSPERAAELIQASAVAASWSQHCHEETSGSATMIPVVSFGGVVDVVRRIGLECQRQLNKRFS